MQDERQREEYLCSLVLRSFVFESEKDLSKQIDINTNHVESFLHITLNEK